MDKGNLLGYSEQEVLVGKAIGIQVVPKVFRIDFYTDSLMWLIVEKDLRTQVAYNVIMRDLQKGKTVLDNLKYKNLSTENR